MSDLLTLEEIQEIFNREPIPEKIHWLFDAHRRVQIEKETPCVECTHVLVCDRKVEKRCANYWFGTSAETDCLSCTNHYARYDKESIPCFYCPYFHQAQLAKVHRPDICKDCPTFEKGCEGSNQEDCAGKDRPDRDGVGEILYRQSIEGRLDDGRHIYSWAEISEANREKFRIKADQISALFEGIRKQLETVRESLRKEIDSLNKKLDDRELDLIEAKREERERIRQKLQHSGGVMDVLWITEEDWQALKEGK